MLASRFLRLNGHLKAVSGLCPKNMSMWDKNFEEPITHKDEIMQSKVSGDYKKKTLLPVKAAPSDASCSMFIDKEVLGLTKLLLKEGKSFVASEIMREVYEIIKETQLKKFYKASPDRRDNIITGITLTFFKFI